MSEGTERQGRFMAPLWHLPEEVRLSTAEHNRIYEVVGDLSDANAEKLVRALLAWAERISK